MSSGMGSTTILHSSIFAVHMSLVGHGQKNSPQAYVVRSIFNTGRLAAQQYPPASCQLLTHAPQQTSVNCDWLFDHRVGAQQKLW
jgi:hypothetical protein